MKIYFTSHCTTTDNEAELSSGWRDVGLSESGAREAREMGVTFKDVEIDIICCSDLKRAADTVRLAFGDKYPVIIDKRLRELNYGDFNGKPGKMVEPMKKEHIKKPYPNGESCEQAIARTHIFYKELKEKHPDKAVLIIGHRAARYGLETMANGKSIEECLSTPFKRQKYWEYNI